MNSASRRRQAARVVVFDSDQRVLLIQGRDPADPGGRTWWEIPGGGMDPGEPSAHCAARELAEEAGIVQATVGPVVWTQQVQFTFAGLWFDQDEFIHVAWTEQTELGVQRLEAFEAMAFGERRWWSVDEIVNAESAFLPAWLPAALPAVVAGPLPNEPIDMTEHA